MRIAVTAFQTIYWLFAGSAYAQSYEDFAREKPPCRLAPLNEDQVMAAARKELGENFFRVAGMPERPHRVTPRGCVYEVEYVILSVKDRWLSFDAIDGTAWILVARDGSVFQPLILTPTPKAVGSPKIRRISWSPSVDVANAGG